MENEKIISCGLPPKEVEAISEEFHNKNFNNLRIYIDKQLDKVNSKLNVSTLSSNKRQLLNLQKEWYTALENVVIDRCISEV